MSWTTFHTTPNPTGQELDDNLAALTRMGAFPCTVSGTANAVVLALADTNAPPLAAYQNYQEFGFIATGTSSSTMTIKVGALAALNAYKDTPAGPVVMATGEVVTNCAYIAMYDGTLNSNAGGFHVRPCAMVANSPINPSTLQVSSGATLTRFLTGQYTVAYTVLPANLTQDATVTLTGVQVGDMIQLGLPATVTAGLMFGARVPATGSVTLRAANVTAASIGAFSLVAVRVGVIGGTP